MTDNNTTTHSTLPIITPAMDAANKCERAAKTLERIAEMIRAAKDKIWNGRVVDDDTVTDETDNFYGLLPVDRISPSGLFYISNLPDVDDPADWAKCSFQEILDIVMCDGQPMAVVKLELDKLWPSFTFKGLTWYDDVYM